MSLKIGYYISRFVFPISLIVAAVYRLFSEYKNTNNLSAFTLIIAVLIIFFFIKPIMQLQMCVIEEKGLSCGGKLLEWAKILSIHPYFFGRLYATVKFNSDTGKDHILIYNPIGFRDLFRADMGSKYLDHLIMTWKKNLN